MSRSKSDDAWYQEQLERLAEEVEGRVFVGMRKFVNEVQDRIDYDKVRFRAYMFLAVVFVVLLTAGASFATYTVTAKSFEADVAVLSDEIKGTLDELVKNATAAETASMEGAKGVAKMSLEYRESLVEFERSKQEAIDEFGRTAKNTLLEIEASAKRAESAALLAAAFAVVSKLSPRSGNP